MATTGCNVRKAAAPGAGPQAAAAPGFPTAAGSRAQELPGVEELKCTCAPSPCPELHARGIPGIAGAPVPGKMPRRLPSPPLTRSENPLNRGRNPDTPVVPRPLPSPRRWPPLGQFHPPPSPRGGPLISVTTWEDSLGPGGRHSKSSPTSALPEPHLHKYCFQLIARGGEGRGPGRRPRREAGAPRVGRCVSSAAACTSTTPACKFEM